MINPNFRGPDDLLDNSKSNMEDLGQMVSV